MFKIYEEFENFLEALKTKDKNTEICMRIIPHRNKESNILSAEILMQFLDATGLCHTHHYTDGLKAIQVLPAGAFNIISDTKARESEEKRYEELLTQFNDIIEAEYEKAKNLFINDLGYKNVTKCNITSG
jgi:hypothetical protein